MGQGLLGTFLSSLLTNSFFPPSLTLRISHSILSTSLASFTPPNLCLSSLKSSYLSPTPLTLFLGHPRTSIHLSVLKSTPLPSSLLSSYLSPTPPHLNSRFSVLFERRFVSQSSNPQAQIEESLIGVGGELVEREESVIVGGCEHFWRVQGRHVGGCEVVCFWRVQVMPVGGCEPVARRNLVAAPAIS